MQVSILIIRQERPEDYDTVQEKGQLIIALFQISGRLLQLCILYRKEKIVVKFNPTDLYRLYNTNIHEKIAEQKKKEAMLQ